MNKFFLTGILYFISNLGITQIDKYRKYNELTATARFHNSQMHYDSSIIYYDSAFNLIDFVPYTYLEAALAAMGNQDFNKISDYLEKGMTKGWNPNYMTIDDLSPYYASANYLQTLQKQDSLNDIYLASIDTNFRNEIVQITEEHLLRKQRSTQEPSGTDEQLFEEFLKVVKTHGFPTYPKVGDAHANAYFFLLDQIDSYPNQSFWPELFPSIDTEIEQGNLTPLFYLRFETEKSGS